jgi:hypothetical protein
VINLKDQKVICLTCYETWDIESMDCCPKCGGIEKGLLKDQKAWRCLTCYEIWDIELMDCCPKCDGIEKELLHVRYNEKTGNFYYTPAYDFE